MSNTPSNFLRITAFSMMLAACGSDVPDPGLATDLLSGLVAINTAPSGGDDMRPAVDFLVTRLQAAGFGDDEITVLAHSEKLPNLIVRYRSDSPTRKPLLLMAHLDVVEALPGDWSVEPFALTEKDGYYYGRGTTDNKAGAAILVANLIRYRREGFKPDRDLIVMLTADEETTSDAANWLVTEHRSLVDAEFALNTDGGLVMLRDGVPRAFIMQTSEKIYVSFVLETKDSGGHSSLPRPENAISRLARGLVALEDYRFPISLNETTRAYFAKWSTLAPAGERDLLEALANEQFDAEVIAELDRMPYYNALARTTCTATRLEGGHADNALPQTARAVVNCRVLPQSSAAAAQRTLERLVAPFGVTVTQLAEAHPSPPSPLLDTIVGPVSELAAETWPGITVIPEMSTGATDGLYVRNAGIPVYGVGAIAENPDDIRAHGQDERIRVSAFEDAAGYWYRLVKVLAQPGAPIP